MSKNVDSKCIKWSAEQHRITGKERCALLELIPCLTSLDNPKNNRFELANEIYFKWLELEGSSWLSKQSSFSGTFSYKLDIQWERSRVLCIRRIIWNNIIQHWVSHAPNQIQKKTNLWTIFTFKKRSILQRSCFLFVENSHPARGGNLKSKQLHRPDGNKNKRAVERNNREWQAVWHNIYNKNHMLTVVH